MILMQTFKDGSRHYQELGDDFMVTMKDVAPEAFAEAGRVYFGETPGSPNNTFIDKCYGIVTHGRGSQMNPLYDGFRYSLLNDSGNLFRDLSKT